MPGVGEGAQIQDQEVRKYLKLVESDGTVI